jgi:hypothetical protein
VSTALRTRKIAMLGSEPEIYFYPRHRLQENHSDRHY